MPKTNLELPSIEEIDFEVKEVPKKKTFEVDTKKLRSKISETEQIFENLKQSLDKLKQEEEQFELKKEERKIQVKEIEDYKKKLNESFDVIEIMKQSLAGLNLELEKNNKKLEYYKNISVELSTKIGFSTTKLDALQKQFFYLENKNNELSRTNKRLEGSIIEMEGIISNLKTTIIKKEHLNNRLKEVLEFITKKRFKEGKKMEYYKQQYFDLIGEEDLGVENIGQLKQKLLELSGKNKSLLKTNMEIEEKLKGVSDTLIKLQQEFDSKKEYFNEQDKKVYEIKKKAIRSLTNYQAIKERSEQIEQRYKEVLVRNSLLEEKTKEHLTLLKQLKDRLLMERNSFSEQIEHLKKEHEKRVKALIEQNTTSELGLRGHIKVLESQLDRQKKIFKNKESKDKEIFSTINEKLKYLVEE